MGFTVESGAYYLLGFLYFVLVAYCIRHYVRVYTSKQNPSRSVVVRNQQKKSWAPFFYPMLMLGCLIRGTYMTIKAGSFIRSAPVVVLLNTLPTLILFSAYMIVLLSWAQLYHAADKATALRSIYFITNMLFYGGYIVLYALGVKEGKLDDASDFYHKGLWYLCSFEYFVCSIAFLVYALLLVKFLRVALFATKFDTIKQINYFTFLVVLVSLLRCAFVVVEAVEKLPSEGEWWVFEPVYFALLEVLPLIVMVQIFQMHRAKQTQNPTPYSPLLSPDPPTQRLTIPPIPTQDYPISFLYSNTPSGRPAYYA